MYWDIVKSPNDNNLAAASTKHFRPCKDSGEWAVQNASLIGFCHTKNGLYLLSTATVLEGPWPVCTS